MNKLIGFLCTLILCYSCLDNVTEIEDINREGYHPEIAIPVAQGSFQFSELIGDDNENTYITINEDGILTFVYSGDITNQSSLNIFDEIQLLPFAVPDSNNTILIDLNNNIEIDYAIISGGNISVLITNEYNEPIDVEISLPDLNKDGEIFKKVIGPISPGTTNFLHSELLEGYRIDLEKNELRINMVAILPNGSRRKMPSGTGGFLRSIAFSFIEGYWAYEEIPMDQDTIEIEVFETLRRGDMRFEEPVITVNLKNSFGFPVRSDVRALELYTLDGGTFEVESPYVTDGFDIEYPREVGDFAITSFDFNKDNSNLPEVTSVKPLALFYDMYAIANPDRDTSSVGFMTDSSAIVLQVIVELPLQGAAQDFEARDTLDFDLPSFDSSEVEILNGEFKMVFESTIPVGMNIQALIVDRDGTTIDSILPDEGLFIDGYNNRSGNGSSKTIEFISFDNEQYQKWKSGEKIHLLAYFTTENYPEPVTIMPDQFLDVKIGLKTEITNL